jgi:hypothetical protein
MVFFSSNVCGADIFGVSIFSPCSTAGEIFCLFLLGSAVIGSADF